MYGDGKDTSREDTAEAERRAVIFEEKLERELKK